MSVFTNSIDARPKPYKLWRECDGICPDIVVQDAIANLETGIVDKREKAVVLKTSAATYNL